MSAVGRGELTTRSVAGLQVVGNSTRGLHDPNRKVARAAYLVLDDSKAMKASVRTLMGRSQRHKIYFELHGFGPTKVVFIMVRPFRLSSKFARWRRGYAGIARIAHRDLRATTPFLSRS